MCEVSKYFYVLDSWQSFVQIKFDALYKWKLSVKNKSKIIPSIFGIKNETSKATEVQKGKVEYFMQSREIKDFSFSMLNNKSELFE